VHLTPEKNLKRIIRNGIKDTRGVFCMPVLRDYYISHQWLRELKRGGQRTIVAVYVRVPSDETVLVGHYGGPHERVPVGQAIKTIMDAPDAQGYELIVPRSIERGSVVRVRIPSQVIGWRFSPTAHGQPPCGCSYCAGGEIKSRKRQEAYDPPDPRAYDDLIAELRRLAEAVAETPRDEDARAIEAPKQEPPARLIASLLWTIAGRRAGTSASLRFLLEYPDDEVAEALAFALGHYRGSVAREMLLHLCQHRHDNVREASAMSLLRIMKGDALPYLAPFDSDIVIARVVEDYRADPGV